MRRNTLRDNVYIKAPKDYAWNTRRYLNRVPREGLESHTKIEE
jgi:hypothetical protein